jgi:hypothetical protein
MKVFISRHRTLWKLSLLLFAVIIGLGSLVYTGSLVEKLKIEERKNVELWAEALKRISLPETSQNLDFFSSIIENNKTIPVILTDETDSIISTGNFNKEKVKDPVYLEKKLNNIKGKNEPIIIDLGENHYNSIYYKDSTILTMLIYYPFIQLGIIVLFILVSYLAFNSSRKADQNQVWVGMSKETAHQLGLKLCSKSTLRYQSPKNWPVMSKDSKKLLNDFQESDQNQLYQMKILLV